MIKILIQVVLFSLLFIGCGNSSDRSNSDSTDQGGGNTSNDKKENIRNLSNRSFTISTKNVLNEDSNKTGLNSFHVTIERGAELVYDNVSKKDNVRLIVNKDDSITFNGFNNLKVNDKVTFSAEGFTPQQKLVENAMVDSMSMTFVLKPIDSRQTFVLGDLDSGRVTSRYTFGASTKVSGDKVTFKTNNGNVALRIDKAGIDALIKKVKRSPKADKNTEIYLDITSIDPKTELDATIGDFTYSPKAEPRGTKSARATSSNDTMLESVVMSSVSMTTSDGEEIHCFGGGEFDEETQECKGDDSKASLRMKIPSSQFDKYAQKYNLGERVVPLYHYSQAQATWIRQTDADNNPLDGELILEDNDNNEKANDGDNLFVEGTVGHFSYWNFDYPRDRGCVKGTVTVEKGSIPDGTVVVAQGSDYSGRKFRESVSKDKLTFSNLGVKPNAKVELYLLYPDRTTSDSIFVQTKNYTDGTCQNIDEVLESQYEVSDVVVTVVDKNQAKLENATVKVGGITKTTDKEGQVTVSIANSGLTVISASYNNGEFLTSASKYINSADTIVLDTSYFTLSGNITLKDNSGEILESRNTYVSVWNKNFYKSVYAVDGKYSIKIPMDKVADLQVYASSYIPTYAKSMTINEAISVSDDAKKEKELSHNLEFILDPFIVSGRVINPFADQDKQGLANITVYTDTQSTQTDDDGNYQFVLFDRTKMHKIYAYDASNGEWASPSPIVIDADSVIDDAKNKDFIIDKRKATITGTVINKKGVPVQGIVLYTSPLWQEAVSDKDGNFVFEVDDKRLFDREVKIYAYDTNDQTNVLAQTRLPDNLKKGKSVDIQEIIISQNLSPVINSVSWDEAVIGQDMVVSVDAYDPENDLLTYTLTFDGKDTVMENGEASISINKEGTLSFSVTVEDGTNDAVLQTKSFIVYSDAKPVVDEVNGFSKIFDKSSDMNIVIKAHDPESAELLYTAELLYYGSDVSDKLTVNGSTFIVSKDIENGNYKLKVMISDGFNTIERSFEFRANDNKAPANLVVKNGTSEIGNTVWLKETDTITLQANATDANDDTLTYRWSFDDDIGSSDGSTLSISSPRVGIFDISVSVSDVKETISKSFKLVIANNLKPVIESVTLTPSKIVKVDDGYQDADGNSIENVTVTINGYDPEGKTLSYRYGAIQTLADAEESNNTKVYPLKGLPLGKQAIKVVVIDGDGEETIKRVVFEIVANKPPKISNLFVPLKAKGGDTVALHIVASDPEGKNLTYTWSANGTTSISVTNKDTKDASFTVPSNAETIQVQVKVSDGVNTLIRERTITIVANTAPVINSFKVLPTVIKEGGDVKFSARVSDAEYDTLSYSWLLDGTTVGDSPSGVLKLSDVGEHNLTLQVSDGDKSVRKTETITVKAIASKPTVTLSSIHKTLLVGQTTTISSAVISEGVYSLKWSGDNLSSENLTSALFTATDVGTYTIGVTAKNSDGVESDLSTIAIVVKDVVASLSSDITSKVVGDEFLFTTTLSDGTTVPTNITWKIVEKPQNATAKLIPNGVTARLTPDIAGTYKVEVSFSVEEFQGSFIATESVTAKDLNTDGESVEGVVKDSDGEVLQGAKVRLYNSINSQLYDESTTTDTEGKYLFTNVPAGEYFLVSSGGNGYINQSQKIIIE